MARKRTRNYRAERSEEFVDEEEKTEDEDSGSEDEEEEEDEESADEEDESGLDDEDVGDDDEEEAPKPKKAAKKKPAAPRKARAVKVQRLKAVWVVYDNSSKEIDTFPFSQKADAEKLVEEKNTDKKGFYLQMKKVPFEE